MLTRRTEREKNGAVSTVDVDLICPDTAFIRCWSALADNF